MPLGWLLAALLLNAHAAADLSAADASRFARLALKCVRQEYPNKPGHVMSGASDVRAPKAMHLAFYGCYDWHSSVHGHWLLARLLSDFPALPEAREARAVFDENLSTAAMTTRTLAKAPRPSASIF